MQSMIVGDDVFPRSSRIAAGSRSTRWEVQPELVSRSLGMIRVSTNQDIGQFVLAVRLGDRQQS